MKALVVYGPNNYRLEYDVKEPELINPHDVLVEITAVGICGSDIHIIHGTHPYVKYPRIIGHEGAGRVIAIGAEVSSVKIGDNVVIEPISYCGKCYACTHQKHNVCSDLEVLGVHKSGTYAQKLVADESHLYKYDDSLSPEQAALAEPFSIGFQANNRAQTQKGDLVLIHGAGPIGIIICNVAKDRGATCIVSDINDKRLAVAKEFGADYAINPLNENLEERIWEISGNSGVNRIIDAAGAPGIMDNVYQYAANGATIVSMTFSNRPTNLDLAMLNKKELTICGSRLEYECFSDVVKSFVNKKDVLSKLVTSVFDIEDYEKAFALASDPKSNQLKVVMTFKD